MTTPTKEPAIDPKKEEKAPILGEKETDNLKRTLTETEQEPVDEHTKRVKTHKEDEAASIGNSETDESKLDSKDETKKGEQDDEKHANIKEATRDDVDKAKLGEPVVKDDTTESSEQDKKPETKPKFTFGGSSAFSLGFGVTKSANAKSFKTNDDKESEDSDKKEGSSKPFAFGSGFAFGAGFAALNQEKSKSGNIFNKDDQETKVKSDSKPEDHKEEDTSETTPVEKDGIVKLEKQNIESGEELEKSIFQANAKLYQLTNLEEGWKERGVGGLHVNENPETGKSRIVMRSRGLLKVILNVPLIKGVSVHKGFPASLQGDKFIRIITVNEEKTPVQYALRTSKAEIAEELYNSIIKLLP
ncbi:LAFE_0B04742g1_1 [Lachancea fermentati]|uniref:LAFE_0B04742g1_1 n=1 Tax=Lachancea fermentati TaxID=4955 RepID=A0A1G4M817_LACFM|nr:LAFE_0B04742g1_1 [Lachancea fermentati]